MTTGKILLVEDHEDNRNIYRTILEHFGYTVFLAGDGEEGIRVAAESHPDLILLDIEIPLLDGLDVARHLKSTEATAHIPIVALTGYAQPEDRARAQAAGFDGYLAKPVAPRTVLDEVHRFLSTSPEQMPSPA